MATLTAHLDNASDITVQLPDDAARRKADLVRLAQHGGDPDWLVSLAGVGGGVDVRCGNITGIEVRGMHHVELVARIGDDGRIHTQRYDHPMHLTFGVDRDLVCIHRDRTTPRRQEAAS